MLHYDIRTKHENFAKVDDVPAAFYVMFHTKDQEPGHEKIRRIFDKHNDIAQCRGGLNLDSALDFSRGIRRHIKTFEELVDGLPFYTNDLGVTSIQIVRSMEGTALDRLSHAMYFVSLHLPSVRGHT